MRAPASRVTAVVVVVALAVVAMACARPPASQPAERELVVFAASSLKESFAALAGDFERANPGVKVRLHLAGSQELRVQIAQGARADVFASADGEQMAPLSEQRLLGPRQVFAGNVPVIVTAAGNPLGIRQVADLQRVSRLVVGAPEVPIGRYTRQILERVRAAEPEAVRNLEAKVVSRELNVRQVLAKVVLGEADAGIVYLTDARTAGDKIAILPIAVPPGVVAAYPVAVLTVAPQPVLARQFVALLLSAPGQRRLTEAGFRGAGDSGR